MGKHVSAAFEETLNAAFKECVNARRDYEGDPTKEAREKYLDMRGVFRKLIIVHQLEELSKLSDVYQTLTDALVETWEGMATIDRWLRIENLESPLPKHFIRDLRVPSLGGKDVLCGTTAKVQGFDFDMRYSEDARKVWDDTFYCRDDYDTEEVRWK